MLQESFKKETRRVDVLAVCLFASLAKYRDLQELSTASLPFPPSSRLCMDDVIQGGKLWFVYLAAAGHSASRIICS